MLYLVVMRAYIVAHASAVNQLCANRWRWAVDLRTVAGRAWNNSVACRCHSSMVSRYTIFAVVVWLCRLDCLVGTIRSSELRYSTPTPRCSM